ncbi:MULTISPECIES: helix-turn-helix transcriptional regulator [Bacillaceae]|jgi:DNA-binding Xre family transcriptional regulator|uniref:Helix-turn-helix transcriptional regulator n=1 Tax=Rossellomorea aquimaris TaxID=189382 RepID=A0A5D4U2F8_9BACI|nr:MULTISPECIES: helix-turn-helix transcriptional regulator [Bacillaceae]KAA0567010.1 helix-turn-helix transcriptional regulator [Bacillus sp. CH30_1T]MDT9027622.1 helix-turn-helix transcriptional regulator [Rossellomorea sp. YC4-1]TYS81289.1 helix-turn-helix transcriptional regulator [Rossellomorea aquimaris]TYS87911.1 helix-turn-helix transcriptional regulator [Rossellomorea aquimaris]TYS90376.1 helix-turn-helix transcriptional regulator [Rossellomorea aquimaris]
MIHQKTNTIVIEALNKFPHKIHIKLGEILRERGLTQGDLHRLTGLRVATINELVNFKKKSLTVAHLVSIMIALRITDIRDLIEIEFDQEVQDYFNEENQRMKNGFTPDLTKTAETNVKRIAAGANN